MASLTSIVSRLNLLRSVRRYLESGEIHNPQVARLLCYIIPDRCPFEREIKFFDRTIFRIPLLCKLNPFYEQVVSLRFKCLCYLADECGEIVVG